MVTKLIFYPFAKQVACPGPDPGQVQRWPLPRSVSPCGLERVLGRPSDHLELGNDSSISETWVQTLTLPPAVLLPA